MEDKARNDGIQQDYVLLMTASFPGKHPSTYRFKTKAAAEKAAAACQASLPAALMASVVAGAPAVPAPAEAAAAAASSIIPTEAQVQAEVDLLRSRPARPPPPADQVDASFEVEAAPAPHSAPRRGPRNKFDYVDPRAETVLFSPDEDVPVHAERSSKRSKASSAVRPR